MATKPDDPFTPPDTRIGEPVPDFDMATEADAELARLHLLSHESSIKSLGLFCYLYGALGLVVAIVGEIALTIPSKLNVPPGETVDQLQYEMASRGLIGIVIAVVSFSIGHGLRRFRAWARWTGLVLCVVFSLYYLLLLLYVLAFRSDFTLTLLIVWLIVFSIFIYPVHLLSRRESGLVFSANYRLVVARTPEIRSRINPIVKALVGLISSLLVLGLIAVIVKLFH